MSKTDATDHVQLVGTLKARPDKIEDLTTIIKSIIPDVKKEPGCISYSAHIDRNNANTVVMLEEWENMAALDTHAVAPAFSKLAASFDELLSEPPVLVTLRQFA